MIRGVKLFYCSECGKRFLGPDIELAASIYSAPLDCPECGSHRTRPWSILPARLANKEYEKIWELTDNTRNNK